MRLNIDETIANLQTVNGQFQHPHHDINTAIKVLKMWDCIRKQCTNVFVEHCPASRQPLAKLCKDIEERFFPSLITQNFMVKVQGKDAQRIRNTADTIECVDGVKEVRMHDKDC